MNMNEMELEAQRQLDEEILHFVRGMQDAGPVTAESAIHYLRVRRARPTITEARVRDRLKYLAKSGLLDEKTQWSGGSVTHYEITARGMDMLDGAIPPMGWQAQKSE
jgi:hypothetical protein